MLGVLFFLPICLASFVNTSLDLMLAFQTGGLVELANDHYFLPSTNIQAATELQGNSSTIDCEGGFFHSTASLSFQDVYFQNCQIHFQDSTFEFLNVHYTNSTVRLTHANFSSSSSSFSSYSATFSVLQATSFFEVVFSNVSFTNCSFSNLSLFLPLSLPYPSTSSILSFAYSNAFFHQCIFANLSVEVGPHTESALVALFLVVGTSTEKLHLNSTLFLDNLVNVTTIVNNTAFRVISIDSVAEVLISESAVSDSLLLAVDLPPRPGLGAGGATQVLTIANSHTIRVLDSDFSFNRYGTALQVNNVDSIEVGRCTFANNTPSYYSCRDVDLSSLLSAFLHDSSFSGLDFGINVNAVRAVNSSNLSFVNLCGLGLSGLLLRQVSSTEVRCLNHGRLHCSSIGDNVSRDATSELAPFASCGALLLTVLCPAAPSTPCPLAQSAPPASSIYPTDLSFSNPVVSLPDLPVHVDGVASFSGSPCLTFQGVLTIQLESFPGTDPIPVFSYSSFNGTFSEVHVEIATRTTCPGNPLAL